MAKRKHSTALFEVITQSSRYAKPPSEAPRPRPVSPGIFAAAKAWLNQKTATKPVEKTVSPQVSLPAPVTAFETASFEPTLSSAAAEAMAPVAVLHESYMDEPSSQEDDLYAQPVAMAVDPENRQIALRMSYSAAFIAAASVVLVVGLSLVIGQRMSRSGAPLLAQTTTAELLRRPAHPEVLDLPHRNSTAGRETLVYPAPPANGEPHAGKESTPATPIAAVDGKRYIGWNYIIVQSYPVAEEKMAKEAAAFLNKEGVSCTIETGVKGYLPIAVVGLQGFDKQSSPVFKAYRQRILQISAKYTSNSHSYKAFEPVPKKWDKLD